MKLYFYTLIAVIFFQVTATADEVTFSEGTNFGISVSPDAKTIAMDLQGIMWTLPINGGVAKAITSGQQPEVREPSWSPNGKKIAFQGYFQNYFHIWTVDKDGKNLKQITAGKFDDREPSWNSDGETIIFASDRTGNYDIWEINLSTGKETQLTTHPDDDAHPNKSLDGMKILHTREIKGRYSEIILNVGGKEAMLFRSEQTSYFRPSWSADNNGFSYISNNGNDIKLNFINDVNSRKVQVNSTRYENSTAIDQGDIFPFRASWTSDGDVYFTGDGVIKHVNKNGKREDNVEFTASITANPPSYTRKSVKFDDHGLKQVLGLGSYDISPSDNGMVFTALGDMWLQENENSKANNIGNETGHFIDPTWSPSGLYLAYVAERSGRMDIWVRNIKSGEEKQLTKDEGREYHLSWSPDGKSLAYLSARTSTSNSWGKLDLKVVDIKFGSTNLIDVELFTPGRPVWSPDGQNLLIAFVKPATSRFREGMHSIKQYSVETHKSKFLDLPNNIGLSTRDGSGPVISPDGQKMTYISEGEIRTVTINGSGEITGSLDNKCLETALMPRWANDSDTLYYFAGKDFRTCSVSTGAKNAKKVNLQWAKSFAENKTLHVGKFFDGVDKEYKTNVDVFITENIITKIVPHGQDEVIGTLYDFSDKAIIPGIMASHSHQSELMGERLGRNWLAYGITSVRDPGTNPYKSLALKETWESGASMGPRIFYAGWLTSGARVYYGQSYSSVNEKALMHELERAKELDYDLLKSYVRLPDEFQQILVKVGHELGIPITGHEIAPAIQNGVDSVEHMGATSRRGYSPKFSSLSKSYDDVMKIISETGLMITPTATLMSGYGVYAARYPQYINQARSQTFLDQLQRDELTGRLNSTRSSLQEERNQAVLKSIKTLHDSGANISAGTDSPFIPYGISQLFELIMFEDAGLTPYEAIRTGTIKAAELMGVENSLGTLEIGKVADMVVLDGDPLLNITDIFNVEATIKDGHVYTIDEMIIDRSQK